jgi:hypothetical protein
MSNANNSQQLRVRGLWNVKALNVNATNICMVCGLGADLSRHGLTVFHALSLVSVHVHLASVEEHHHEEDNYCQH